MAIKHKGLYLVNVNRIRNFVALRHKWKIIPLSSRTRILHGRGRGENIIRAKRDNFKKRIFSTKSEADTHMNSQ
ncbi:hypothetical protein I79_021477 [Cricetulus griseus]|uniref:Uncharacterized protein n=1 Tax=Cricetulus griseus TaxID=10029 RepID=G3ICS8_CRIGR|nr:hypothetical protein I79_021477 [Cricetulus griseus]